VQRNLITIGDLTTDEILVFFRETKHFKKLRAPELRKYRSRLRGRRLLLLFLEPSTRTRVSFEVAGYNLGMDVVTVTAGESSVVKGESLVDCALTLGALGFHLAVVRHKDLNAVKTFSSYFDGSVINGGEGSNSHPTQALVDAFTLWERGLLHSDLRIGICGDIAKSRVARSNARLLNRFGIVPYFIAPPELLPSFMHSSGEIVDVPGEAGFQVQINYALDDVISSLDVLMMLRIQRERRDATAKLPIAEFTQNYQLNAARLQKLPQSALIMHPGPVNRGVEVTDQVFADPRCEIVEQVRNGLLMRMSVLGHLLK